MYTTCTGDSPASSPRERPNNIVLVRTCVCTYLSAEVYSSDVGNSIQMIKWRVSVIPKTIIHFATPMCIVYKFVYPKEYH